MVQYSLRQLEYLVACIDTGSVAGAAQKLNVSQPSISVSITKLEATLGVQLLIRHHAQGVSPTAAAERLVQSGRNLLSHAYELQRQAHLEGEAISGELRVGSFITIAPSYLPSVIKNLKGVHPEILIQLREGTQDQLISKLRDGLLEMAFLYDEDLPEDLRKVELATVSPYVLLPRHHPLVKRKSVSLSELAPEPFILLDVQPSRRYFTGLFEAEDLTPNIAYSSSSLETVRGLVGCGLGFSLLVTRPKGDLTYDGAALVVRPIKEMSRQSRIVLASLNALRPTQIMKSFEEFSVAHFKAD